MIAERTVDKTDFVDELVALQQRVQALEQNNRKLKRQLQASETRLAQSQRIAVIGSWEWNVVNDEVFWTDECYHICGLDPRSYIITQEGFLQRIHPDDRQHVLQMAGKTLASGLPYLAEFRIVLDDGTIRHVRDQAELQYDQQNKPLRFIGVVQDITDEVTARMALKKSETKWRSLVANAPNYITLTDTNANITFINKTVEGLPVEDVVGQSLYSFIAPDYIDVSKHAVRHVLQTNEIISYEALSLYPVGQGRWYSTSVVAIHEKNEITGLMFIDNDITEQKQLQDQLESRVKHRTKALSQINKELQAEIAARESAEAALRERELLYRTLTTISPVGIFQTNFSGSRLFVNERWSEITGILPEQAGNMAWAKGVHAEDKERVLHEWSLRPSIKGLFKTEYRFVRPDGSTIWVLGQTMPVLNEDGSVDDYVGTITDITKLREAQEQARQRQSELAHFLRFNTVGEMATSIAHELNQPLTAIVNYIGGSLTRLRTYGIPEQVIDSMQRAAKQAEHAGAIIHRLKEFLHKGSFSKSWVNANDVIRDALVLVEIDIKSAKITVDMQLADDLPVVKVDGIQIGQVIFNLLHNAIEVMHHHQSATRRLSVSTCLQSPDGVAVNITDSGPGVPAVSRDRIFDAFFTTKTDGMGMGLSISRSIVEAHGGQITLEQSESNAYNRFRVFIPINSESEQ